MKGKDKILGTCKKLKKLGVIEEIKQGKYSIKILVKSDYDEYNDDDILIRNRIKSNFIKEGYKVVILGVLWLEIYFEDIKSMIDDCFEGD